MGKAMAYKLWVGSKLAVDFRKFILVHVISL